MDDSFGAGFVFINICPSILNCGIKIKRLRILANGCELLRLFLVSVVLSVLFQLTVIITGKCCSLKMIHWQDWVFTILLLVVVESLIFWNGIIRVYLTSAQLAFKWRLIGILCGWIPIAHLFALCKIIGIASREVDVENAKFLLDENRNKDRICATKYPVLLVHGVFFRDFRYFNYWGRIPAELERNGAIIYYGNHQSAASVADSAKELTERIKDIVRMSGCEKVNIIAHSKGGLDCRYALSLLDASPYVASLTTINTPHRGCEFADYLLSKISEDRQKAVAHAYNTALRKLGDTNPDFLASVYDLTAEACRRLNEKAQDVEGIYYQSVGSVLKCASGGRFPLNFTHALVKYVDGENDGLVGRQSFVWGERFRYLSIPGKRGISHGDMIDLNRENFKGFDVRELYVQLVQELKMRGF